MGVIKIFILHGWTYDTKKWDEFISLLKSDSNKIELLKIPGLTAELERVYTVDDYVKWLKKEIGADEKVVLIGHSNGGRIASFFAATYPEKVSNLILIDSAGIYHNDIKIKTKRFIFKTIAKTGRKITHSKLLEKFLYKIVGERDYKEARPLVKKTMENLITSDVTPLLKNITAPTLIIWGEHDKVTPLTDGKRMHWLIAQSKIAVIKDARHSPQFTHTEKVVKIIKDTLS